MDYYCVDWHAPVCSGDDSVWCNWCQSSTHRFCGNGLRIDDEQYLAYKRVELKIYFSCKICTVNHGISYQGEVTFYQTPSVPKNGMNDTSIEFEIADLDVVSDNEIKEQLLKFNTPQRPSASFTLATGCHQQGHKPACAHWLACQFTTRCMSFILFG